MGLKPFCLVVLQTQFLFKVLILRFELFPLSLTNLAKKGYTFLGGSIQYFMAKNASVPYKQFVESGNQLVVEDKHNAVDIYCPQTAVL